MPFRASRRKGTAAPPVGFDHRQGHAGGCAPMAISRNTVLPTAASSLVATDTLDNDFRSFVRSRDPAALAAVFDAAAPRLLLAIRPRWPPCSTRRRRGCCWSRCT
ncbi:MAG: hypothetical protein MUC36_24440 [Planctomycetes bacterium]|nr:hypothetical protein [Planctomycetota bacterium]